MRKILFTVTVLAIVLTMSNCKDDNDTEEAANPLIGTWERGGTSEYVFTENNVNFRAYAGDVVVLVVDNTGVYTFDGKWAIITYDTEALMKNEVILYDESKKHLYSLGYFYDDLKDIDGNTMPPETYTPFPGSQYVKIK